MIPSSISSLRQLVNTNLTCFSFALFCINLLYFWQTVVSVPDDADADLDDETQALLTSDFEIGHYIRERIVPRAVLYYTGNIHVYVL